MGYELSYAEDKAQPKPDEETLLGLYRQYFKEGHIIEAQPFDDVDLDGATWYATCSCGATHWGTPYERDGEPLTYHDMKWWAREHRTQHGLDWQEWIPGSKPMTRFEQGVATGEHVLFLHHDQVAERKGESSWVACCSCDEWGEDLLQRQNSHTEAEARALGDAHLREHGGTWDL